VNCDAIAQLKGLVYTCEICGHNLQIEYDYEAIRKSWNKDTLKHNSDYTIWRYMPLYPVETRIDYPPIGWTPLFEVPKLAKTMNLRSLFVKDDGRNPSASFKDRATAIALMRAKELGCDLVTGASTGNAASSTAVLAAVTGIKAKIFIPRTAPRAKVAQIMTFGAEVLAVDGVYDDAFDLCLAATQKFGWYNRNTGYNPFTREGKKSVSFEICEQMAWDVPDLVVVPVGDGNIISGVWKGFQDFYRIGFIDRLPRLLAVQAEHSDAIIRAFEGDGTISPVSGDTVADSISVSIPRDGKAALQAIQQSNGLCMRVSDQEILNAIPTLARNTGVFGEPAASTSLAGLQKAVAQGHIDPNWKIVLLLTGNGLKDIASAIKVAGEPPIIAPNPDALNDMM
jgi:threonine synthase